MGFPRINLQRRLNMKLKIKRFFKRTVKFIKFATVFAFAVALVSTFVVYKVEKTVYDKAPMEVMTKLAQNNNFMPPYIGILGWTGEIRSITNWKRSLTSYGSDNACKAIIIVLDSPGGGATISNEIGMYIEKFKNQYPSKQLIFYTREMMASGAYLIAVGGDRIYAQEGALVGSIGVVLEHTDLSGLYQKIGVKITPYATGKHKDMFGDRQPDATEKQIINDILNEPFELFKNHILEHRGRIIEERTTNFDSTWAILTDGRILTSKQAELSGLTDGTYKNLDELINDTKIALGNPGIHVLNGAIFYKGEINWIMNTSPKDDIIAHIKRILSMNITSAQLMEVWRP